MLQQRDQAVRYLANAPPKVLWLLSRLRPRLIPEGLVLVIVLILAGSFVLEIASPFEVSVGRPQDRLDPPDWRWGFWKTHLLGTDGNGRDVFLRVMVGARVSLQVAAIALGIAGVVGLAVGMVAGYYRGWVDMVLMRLTDAVLAVPLILLALIAALVFGPSLGLVSLLLASVFWAQYARMIRGETLSVVNRDFVSMAHVLGAGGPRIIVTHIFPHVRNTWVVLLSLQVGVAILAESSLSFLGAGVPPPAPSWGSMAAEGRRYIDSAWWASVFPGVGILVVVLCFNLLGDWLRDRLDPKFQ